MRGQAEGTAASASAATAIRRRQRTSELAGDQAAAAPPEAKMMESTSDPEYSLVVEVAYHGARQAFLACAHRWMMFLTIVFGASAAVPFWGEKVCALLAAATAAADMAFNFVDRAQAHADLKRRYFEMVGELSRGELSDFGARWMVISADEPPLHRWASEIAHRNACITLDREVPDLLPWWKRMLAQVWHG